nr:immunoglobulin heavy chain junction region [Macaca mulatta]
CEGYSSEWYNVGLFGYW